jgi:hypothetical protein
MRYLKPQEHKPLKSIYLSLYLLVVVPSYYTGYTSKNYRNVFDADYNQSNLFTASFGIAGQGLGTVVITANYNGAVFSVSGTTNYTATINNVAYSPTPEELAVMALPTLTSLIK